jgi:hypothetical protein
MRPRRSACRKSKRWAKGLSVGAEQAGDGFARGDGSSVGEDDVAADAERWVRARDGDGVVKGGASGHQRGGGEDSGGVEFADSAIDARGEAEVVGVEDEAGGHGRG